MHWGIPLNMWILLVVIDEERNACCGKGFGGAPDREVRMFCNGFIGGNIRDTKSLILMALESINFYIKLVYQGERITFKKVSLPFNTAIDTPRTLK